MLFAFQAAAAAVLLAVGLSQIYAGGAWTAFYRALAERGAPAVRLYGMGALAAGALIVAVHNIWTGPVLVLTLVGWMMVAEGVTCVFFPALGLMGFRGLAPEVQARAVRLVGAFVVVMAGVLALGLLWK